MDATLWVIGLAVAALLAVALVVACWEQLRGDAAARWPLPPPHPPVAKVDVELELLASDLGARHHLLDMAMARMAEPSTEPAAHSWTDTLPTGMPAVAHARRSDVSPG